MRKHIVRASHGLGTQDYQCLSCSLAFEKVFDAAQHPSHCQAFREDRTQSSCLLTHHRQTFDNRSPTRVHHPGQQHHLSHHFLPCAIGLLWQASLQDVSGCLISDSIILGVSSSETRAVNVINMRNAVHRFHPSQSHHLSECSYRLPHVDDVRHLIPCHFLWLLVSHTCRPGRESLPVSSRCVSS